MPLAWREALRKFEMKAVAAVADPRGSKIRAVAVGEDARGKRVVDQDQEAQRRVRLFLVLRPAGDPVAVCLVEKAAQHPVLMMPVAPSGAAGARPAAPRRVTGRAARRRASGGR